jgi:16S rRNA (uracil1498-N3)-methyltransferase
MADRFYLNCPLAVGRVVVEGPEGHHLAAVCRIRPGDRVCLFNGDGHEYPALVVATSRHEVLLDVQGTDSPEREVGFRLEVAAPLPKGDRAQFLLEKLTELGVTHFVPLQTERSVVKPREVKREKLERWVVEASKQCGRNILLQVQAPADWTSYCARGDLPELRVLAHPGASGEPWPARQDAALAVGPEGGLTPGEVETAQQAGWRLASLGKRILRVETAALVMAARSV